MMNCEHKYRLIEEINNNSFDGPQLSFYCVKCLHIELKQYCFQMEGTNV